MKVDQQSAIEGAPSLILPDGDGGVTFHLITDEVLLAAVTDLSDANGWNEEERQGLYEALANVIEQIGGAVSDD